MKKFTRDELLRHSGRDGMPAYIAYEGNVYDVSGSWHWKGGRHQALHSAGEDLTAAIESAPHGADLLQRVTKIGTLSD